MKTIILPTGAELEVPTDEEAWHAEKIIAAYQETFDSENVSDLEDLNKVVTNELLIHRWNKEVASGFDIHGKPANAKTLQALVQAASTETRLLKKQLGIDKIQRDKTSGQGSTAERIKNLLERAEKFGVMRNQQAARAVELAYELIALVEFHHNCNDKEQRQFGATQEDIIEWISTVFKTEFNAIDEAFRDGEQKMWIRDQ